MERSGREHSLFFCWSAYAGLIRKFIECLSVQVGLQSDVSLGGIEFNELFIAVMNMILISIVRLRLFCHSDSA